MADQLKIQTVVTLARETPAETLKFYDKTLIQTPDSHERGEITLAAATVDRAIATDVNIFCFSCDTPVSLKIGSDTATALTGIKNFSYSGSTTSFFISNSETTTARLYFVSSTVK